MSRLEKEANILIDYSRLDNDLKKVITVDFQNFQHFFCFQIKYWSSGWELSKCLSEKQTEKTLIRLLLQKQSDLVLPCLSRLEKEANILTDYSRLDNDLKEVFTVNVLKFQTVFFFYFQMK